MVGIRSNMTLAVFSDGASLKTAKATETQCRTETNISGYSEDEESTAEAAENRRRAWRHPKSSCVCSGN